MMASVITPVVTVLVIHSMGITPPIAERPGDGDDADDDADDVPS